MTTTRLLQDILSQLDRGNAPNNKFPDGKGEYWALCPFHDDNHAKNFSVSDRGFNCFACDKSGGLHELAQHLGINHNPPQTPKHSHVVATYDYQSENGTLLYQCVRYDPKDFKQRKPDGKGGWTWNLRGVGRVLYNLPLIASAGDQWIFVVEGEKDADNLLSIGLFATTNVFGASKWQASYSETLRGHKVAILPDNDTAGHDHAKKVYNALSGIASDVRIVNLPNLADKQDVSDWLAIGGTRDELLNLVENAQDSDPWRVFTLVDAYKPRDPVEYVVEGIFEKPSLNIPYGPPGALKSMLMADMAICVASGIPWLEPGPGQNCIPKSIVQQAAMWLDFDNGQRRTHERFAALGRGHNAPETIPLYYYSMPSPWLDASDQQAMATLAVRIKKLQVGLVLVDNLGVVSIGADENAVEMVPILSNFRQLSEETGTTIIIIHHPTKNYKGKAGGDSLRGHSSILASLDLALLCEREEYSDNVVIKSTKTRGVDVDPFTAMWTYTHCQGTNDLEEARFFGMETPDLNPNNAIKNAVFDILKANPSGLKQNEVVTLVQEDVAGAAINKIRWMLDSLASKGLIDCAAGARNAKIYTSVF